MRSHWEPPEENIIKFIAHFVSYCAILCTLKKYSVVGLSFKCVKLRFNHPVIESKGEFLRILNSKMAHVNMPVRLILNFGNENFPISLNLKSETNSLK